MASFCHAVPALGAHSTMSRKHPARLEQALQATTLPLPSRWNHVIQMVAPSGARSRVANPTYGLVRGTSPNPNICHTSHSPQAATRPPKPHFSGRILAQKISFPVLVSYLFCLLYIFTSLTIGVLTSTISPQCACSSTGPLNFKKKVVGSQGLCLSCTVPLDGQSHTKLS